MLAVIIRFKGSMKCLVPSLKTFHATSLRSSASPSPPHYFKQCDKGAISATVSPWWSQQNVYLLKSKLPVTD